MIENLSEFPAEYRQKEVFFSTSEQSLRTARSYISMGISREKRLASFFVHQADPELLSVRAGNHPLYALRDKLPSYRQEPCTDIPLPISLNANEIWLILFEYDKSYRDYRVGQFEQSLRGTMQERFELDKKTLTELYNNYVEAGGLDFSKRPFLNRLWHKISQIRRVKPFTSIVSTFRSKPVKTSS